MAASASSLDVLACQGEQSVAEMVEAAEALLARLQDLMAGPSFWSLPPGGPSSRTDLSAGAYGRPPEGTQMPEFPPALADLEAAHRRYKETGTILRGIITQISEISERTEDSQVNGSTHDDKEGSDAELSQLESRAAMLKKEIQQKNVILKSLIDQLRFLLDDIILFQSCPLVPT